MPNRQEYEHGANISAYEDGNSFIQDEGGADDVLLDNAEEKLKNLALQLGEGFCTQDLAALMSQKRDIELEMSARKVSKTGVSSDFRRLKKAQTQVARRSASADPTIELIKGLSSKNQ